MKTNSTKKRIYMKQRITNYFTNAKIDYDINAQFISCEITGDRMLIKWVEEGQPYTMVISHINDYTAEEAYNIWQESDWSFWADDTEEE